jgi:glycosyltransferase involved in cell wall biosynthesis
MPHEPLVSVIMSVHNCEPYIEEALGSVLAQTYQNLEVIIFDDGSTDETGVLIANMAKYDTRIIHCYRKQQGIANCLNEALLLAQGEFIARMDGDDISLPERIERQMMFLKTHPDVDMVGCWLKLFGDRNEVWHYRTDDNFIKNMFLLFTNGVGHNAILVRAAVYKRFRYDPEYTDVEDTELWTRMAVSQPSVCFANMREILVHYRIHNRQSSVLWKDRQRELYRRIISKYLDYLGVAYEQQNMSAHEWLIDNPSNMSFDQFYQLAHWLNVLSIGKKDLMPDEFGVLAERWHHLCRKNQASLDIYSLYKGEFDICWLPPIIQGNI